MKNFAHMRDIDWDHYLSVFPDEDPTEWLQNIVNGFRWLCIDYFHASNTIQEYMAKYPEHQDVCVEYLGKVLAEERRQDMDRARKYNEKRRHG